MTRRQKKILQCFHSLLGICWDFHETNSRWLKLAVDKRWWFYCWCLLVPLSAVMLWFCHSFCWMVKAVKAPRSCWFQLMTMSGFRLCWALSGGVLFREAEAVVVIDFPIFQTDTECFSVLQSCGLLVCVPHIFSVTQWKSHFESQRLNQRRQHRQYSLLMEWEVLRLSWWDSTCFWRQNGIWCRLKFSSESHETDVSYLMYGSNTESQSVSEFRSHLFGNPAPH